MEDEGKAATRGKVHFPEDEERPVGRKARSEAADAAVAELPGPRDEDGLGLTAGRTIAGHRAPGGRGIDRHSRVRERMSNPSSAKPAGEDTVPSVTLGDMSACGVELVHATSATAKLARSPVVRTL